MNKFSALGINKLHFSAIFLQNSKKGFTAEDDLFQEI